ncbi:methionyl-tRNA formyltransferase [Winogradskyella jejuensis]|uniref:Methionyl-tRNA formyltransferase n=1 Tax=Winogradskyella jejuensis TaxID=1089305 RepID=A0A1M5V4S4_9FLAO|nr:methionyl-tRNA formyltransferase [Winogradskyella jejuensis]SHH69963.1 methionyl-tRNA formyltransferase [Winogradskyella jejuensis]
MTKKRDIRIVFMGTPDFAVETLKTILEHNYKVVGVITAPDRPAGRGRKLKSSAVKEFALEQGLKILQPTNLKSEEFIEELESLNANLQIVVAFRMLPKVVWQMPEYGTFNLHASLLPNYRGAAPIHWAIINGEEKTGATTFFIDEKIDTGAIILKQETDIGADETVGQLHDKLMHLGSDLVVKTIEHIETNTVETKIQSETKDLKTAYKLNRDNCKINWEQNLDTIYNKIRGLNPFPTAWCYLNNGGDKNLSVKLYDVSKIEELHDYENGAIIITDNKIKVACKNGFINIEELQLPNKRKMDAKALLNGYEFEKNAKML